MLFDVLRGSPSNQIYSLSSFTGRSLPGILRCIDVMSLMQDQLAILSGGRDRRGGAIITFPSAGRRDRAKPDDYRLLLQYLMSIPRYS